MSDKPSYLGLLNVIAVNEARAHQYLQVWIDKTTDPDVKAVLRTVAWREGEHGMSFAKRVNELGYELRDRDDLNLADRLEVAGSDRSDLEKMEYFGQDRLDEVLGAFDTIFQDHTIDIQTGELLGRYVAEEFDTARLLRCCYEQLKARQGDAAAATASSSSTPSSTSTPASSSTSASSSTPASSELAALNDKVDALCRAVEELRQIVCAQTMATKAS